MAKTNAQRQADYRKRHLQYSESVEPSMRVNMIVSVHAKSALGRLSKCYGVTQRQLLENLLANFETSTIERLAVLTTGQEDYYNGKAKLSFDVTQ